MLATYPLSCFSDCFISVEVGEKSKEHKKMDKNPATSAGEPENKDI